MWSINNGLNLNAEKIAYYFCKQSVCLLRAIFRFAVQRKFFL